MIFHKISIEFKGSTLILIQHEEEIDYKFDKISDKKKFIIGAVNHISWRKEVKYQGSTESYVFTLMPKFRNYFAKRKPMNSQNTTNIRDEYCYMSLDRQKSTKIINISQLFILFH